MDNKVYLSQASPGKRLRGGREYSGEEYKPVMDCANIEIKHFIMLYHISITKYIRMFKFNI